MDESAVENMLVASLESLYSEDDYELDIRKGLLRIILQILQRHGKASYFHGQISCICFNPPRSQTQN